MINYIAFSVVENTPSPNIPCLEDLLVSDGQKKITDFK